MVYQVSQIHASVKYDRTANEYISPTYLIQFIVNLFVCYDLVGSRHFDSNIKLHI